MNSQKFKKIVYPENFTDDDKLEFDLLLEQSKMLFPKLVNEEWLLSMGIISYINQKKTGTDEPPSQEEIAKIKNQYSQDNIFYFNEPCNNKEIVEAIEAIEVKE